MGSDLCFWKDTFWLVHARTSAHVAPDLQRWDEVAVLKKPYHVGDAKLAVTDDELLVYTADSHHELEESGKERQVG